MARIDLKRDWYVVNRQDRIVATADSHEEAYVLADEKPYPTYVISRERWKAMKKPPHKEAA